MKGIFIIDIDKNVSENAKAARDFFPFLNVQQSLNLMNWFAEHPGVGGSISLTELETLEGLVW